MRGPALFAAALISSAPLLLEAVGRLDPLPGVRLGWALLPWLALAGLPRGGPAARRDPWEAALVTALPVIVLAAALDGRDPGADEPWAVLGLASVSLALLGAARARGGRLYAWAWCLVLALPAVAGTAFGASASSGVGGAPAGLGLLWRAGPLDPAWELLRSGEAAAGPLALLVPAALCLVAQLDAQLDARPRGGPDGEAPP